MILQIIKKCAKNKMQIKNTGTPYESLKLQRIVWEKENTRLYKSLVS